MNNLKYKTSVIVPYFNEESNLEYTFDLLQNQTYKPDEIIFIDSNSSDDSYNKLCSLIEHKNFNKIQIFNFKTKLKSPSECKNFGISKSNYNWLLFMDCELKFKENWIQDQLIHQSNSKKDVIFGVAYITGKTLFDRSCIFQTFGYKSKTPIIPSSLIHKSVFETNGNFLPIRSTYDRVWISKIRTTSNYSINYKTKIDYLNYAYARSPIHLFVKTVNLCLQALFLKKYNTPYFYLITLAILIWLNDLKIYTIFFFINILLRGFFLPFFKNKKYYFKNLKLILLHIMSGFIIDIARFFGFSLGLILKLFNVKLRLDSFIRK